MKTQIRRKVFETNSSSVHSLTTFTKSDFIDWIEGRKKYCPDTEKLVDNDIADCKNKELVRENKNNLICDDKDLYLEKDLEDPFVCEILIGQQFLCYQFTLGYLSYDRYIHCIEYNVDNLNWIYNENTDTVEFGYEGWGW